MVSLETLFKDVKDTSFVEELGDLDFVFYRQYQSVDEQEFYDLFLKEHASREDSDVAYQAIKAFSDDDWDTYKVMVKRGMDQGTNRVIFGLRMIGSSQASALSEYKFGEEHADEYVLRN